MIAQRSAVIVLVIVLMLAQGCTALLGGGKKRPAGASLTTHEHSEDLLHGH